LNRVAPFPGKSRRKREIGWFFCWFFGEIEFRRLAVHASGRHTGICATDPSKYSKNLGWIATSAEAILETLFFYCPFPERSRDTSSKSGKWTDPARWKKTSIFSIHLRFPTQQGCCRERGFDTPPPAFGERIFFPLVSRPFQSSKPGTNVCS
jgi:hypothetical protein